MGMIVTSVDRQQSGKEPRRISQRTIMLSFGVIISATIFRNRGNTPKGSTPPYVSRSRSRRRITGVWKSKEFHQLRKLRQKCGKQAPVNNYFQQRGLFIKSVIFKQIFNVLVKCVS